jgi:nucleotide-binding universal stress UspA family protein
MAIRTILAAASGGSASNGAMGLACQFAHRLNAHVEGFHVIPDRQTLFGADGEGFAMMNAALTDSLLEAGAANALKTRAGFDEIVKRHQLAKRNSPTLQHDGPSACWREETGYAPSLVASRARFFDLVVLGRSGRVVDEAYTHTIEQTLAQCGRPVLLAQGEMNDHVGSVVAVAWNGSPQAVRAVGAALPILATADAITVITVGDRKPSDDGLREYLAWHGITAKFRSVPAVHGRSTGALLLDTASEAAADILVMGGYGHRPWREALFGGVTRDILGSSKMPLLLVH